LVMPRAFTLWADSETPWARIPDTTPDKHSKQLDTSPSACCSAHLRREAK